MLRSTATVVLTCLLLVSPGTNEAPVTFESRTTQRAQQTYNRAISDAKKAHLSRAMAVTKAYVRALDSAMRGATRRGDLDEATLIKQEKKTVEALIEQLKVDMFASEIDNPAILEITGTGFTIEPFGNGQLAYSDRNHTWINVPRKFKGWQFTRTRGRRGNSEISIKVKRTGMIFVATGAPKEFEEAGWSKLDDLMFNYNAAGRPGRVVLAKPMAAGQTMTIPPTAAFGGTIVITPSRNDRR